MKKIISTIVASIFVTCLLSGQNKNSLQLYPDFQKREVQVIKQIWNTTDNAAGMGYSNVNSGSLTSLNKYYSNGDHHRVQEGSANNGLTFSTERYDRFSKKVYVRGSFAFNMNTEKDRAWSDVVNTYNSNPYIFGSSVRGDYGSQNFDLNLKVFSVKQNGLNYGFTINYHVADISRQRDPRSRTYVLDYSVIPSVTYSFNSNNSIGVNLNYRFDKEKMPGLSTVQTDPNLKYYTFSGLENAIGRIGGYRAFSRQFIGDNVGGALQYNFKNKNVNWLISIGMDAAWQETLGDKKQSPGSFNSFNYNILSNLLIQKNHYLHNFIFNIKIKDSGADEHRQNLVSSRDTLTGITTENWVTIYTYKNRFVSQTSDMNLKWDLYSLKKSNDSYNWRVGINAGYSSFSNVYYLPKSDYSAGRLVAGLSSTYVLTVKKQQKLFFEGRFNSGINTGAELNLASQTEISENILIPDLEFHKRNTAEVYGSVKYTFPLQFVKNSRLSGYAKLYGGNLFAGKANWSNFGFAIGILTL
jgi:hypothetical protein